MDSENLPKFLKKFGTSSLLNIAPEIGENNNDGVVGKTTNEFLDR